MNNQSNNINLANLLIKLKIPLKQRVKILIDLNTALGYSIYSRYKDLLSEEDKKALQQLAEKDKTNKLIDSLLKK